MRLEEALWLILRKSPEGQSHPSPKQTYRLASLMGVNHVSLALKTGFSARALFGLLGSDNVTLKVSPNGSAFFDAFVIDRATGRAEFPAPIVIPGLSALPASPPVGKLALYGRQRAGAPWLEVVRPSGRDFPLQPHWA